MSEKEKEREAIWNRRGVVRTRAGAAIESAVIPVDSPSITLSEIVMVESPRFASPRFASRDLCILLSHAARLLYSSVSLRCAEKDVLPVMPKPRNTPIETSSSTSTERESRCMYRYHVFRFYAGANVTWTRVAIDANCINIMSIVQLQNEL